MEDQLISFKTAKLAKEKGFDWECNKYNRIGNLYNLKSIRKIDIPFSYPAPTQSLLQRWLRENHNIVVESVFNSDLYRKLHEKGRNKKALNYHWTITANTNDPEYFFEKFYSEDTFQTYEEALEEGLQEALKLI